MKIPILMEPLLTKDLENLIISNKKDRIRFNKFNDYWGPNAKWLLTQILSSVEFSENEEIAILTSSNRTYVSSCISLTAFNFSKISRSVNSNTKVIIIIYEFGWTNEKISRNIKKWKAEGKLIIEDFAHVFVDYIIKEDIENNGDYLIFSLPKIIPSKSGGFLLTKKKITLNPMTNQESFQKKNGIKAGKKFLGYINLFNKWRLCRDEFIKKNISSDFTLDKPGNCLIPYFTGFFSPLSDKIRMHIDYVEWGATLEKNLLYIPTNPLVKLEYYKKLIKDINILGKKD
tara:strand:+ start:643 stop:1503 length:861 start_codon:yes stop_codon:yes gene_type:complete